MWQYKIYEDTWKKVINFIGSGGDSEKEYAVKIIQRGCTVALTNLGNCDKCGLIALPLFLALNILNWLLFFKQMKAYSLSNIEISLLCLILNFKC